jgi:hypothetical protein
MAGPAGPALPTEHLFDAHQRAEIDRSSAA